jgi:aminopeptidase N
VPEPRLTRKAAAARAAAIDVCSYLVELDLADQDWFESTTTVRFRTTEDGVFSWLDLVADHVIAVTVDGDRVDASEYRPADGIALPGLGPAGDHVVTVRARCWFALSGQGLSRHTDENGDVYLHTQFEPAFAKRVFGCFDQPDMKACWDIKVTAPAEWTVLSNSHIAATDDLEDGRRTVTFATTPPLPPYLVCVLAGPFVGRTTTYRRGAREIPLGVHCARGRAGDLDVDAVLADTVRGMDAMHDMFGTDYPFAKYDQCFVPGFGSAGMENAACVSLSDDLVHAAGESDRERYRRAVTMFHELAHMWFGDLVTPRWWDDLWLNEAFATWAGAQALAGLPEYDQVWVHFSVNEKSLAYRQDRPPSTHPVLMDVDDDGQAFAGFDMITYAKGAAALRQLSRRVGPAALRTALNRYFERHAWSNAEFCDLLDAVAEVVDHPVRAWADSWLRRAGVDVLRPIVRVDDRGVVTGAEIVSDAAADHLVSVGVYDDPGSGALVLRDRLVVDLRGGQGAMPDLIGGPAAKLLLVNDDDQTYASVRTDAAGTETLCRRITDIADPLARAQGWSALWDMTGGAELPASRFVRVVLDGVAREQDPVVVQRLLHQVRTALASYVCERNQAEGWRALSLRSADLARRDPGLLGELFSSVLGQQELADVCAMLDGDGLSAPLRGPAAACLVAHGAIDIDDVPADCRQPVLSAAVPDVAAKWSVWGRIIDVRTDRFTRAALLAGFAHPAQTRLLERFTPEYFHFLSGMDDAAPVEQVVAFAMGAFPRWSVNAETIALADDWIARRPKSVARQAVGLGRAELAAALAARELDEASTGASPRPSIVD